MEVRVMRFSAGELLIGLIVLAVAIVGWWKIFSRLGYPGIMGLTMLIPVVNAVAFLWIAFLPWPIEDAMEEARSSSGQP
jgi:membrane glycosyltransferase